MDGYISSAATWFREGRDWVLDRWQECNGGHQCNAHPPFCIAKRIASRDTPLRKQVYFEPVCLSPRGIPLTLPF